MAPHFHSVPKRVNVKTIRAFQRGLLRWYRRERRDLPWRRTRDPYRIWVSEIMLQQTRVDVVVAYYERWLRAFPTVDRLARARADRALKLWEGLGYYSRARNLHRAARLVAAAGRSRPAGRSPTGAGLPTTYAGWLELPGVGRYTAAAIASIAFGEPTPVVDGNVARVLARVFCVGANVKLPATLEQLFELAGRLLPVRAAGDFNQALMELGALVCLPAKPNCPVCPLRSVCLARARGVAEELPNRGKPLPMRAVTERVALVRQGGRVLVRQRPGKGLLGRLWELPPLGAARGRELFALKHTITQRRITLRVVETATAPVAGKWIGRRDLERLAFPAAQRRALERIFSAEDQDR